MITEMSLFEQGLVLFMLVMTPYGVRCMYERFKNDNDTRS